MTISEEVIEFCQLVKSEVAGIWAFSLFLGVNLALDIIQIQQELRKATIRSIQG